jgi:two-component system C4-dicarboxylate transport sensor histidine kinase DctB
MSWRRLWLPALLAALAVAIVAAAAFRWASAHARSETADVAAQAARNHQGLLLSELQKFRLLPLVLSEYPDVRAVLEGAGGATAERLNLKLELLAERTDAAVIYVVGADGSTLAASNWRLPTSFVGHRYGFRPYFRGAMESGAAELFALGTVSGRPGLFIARRIAAGGRALGVVVVKVEFDGLEAEWARQAGPTFVTDADGVIIITSRPDWRFRSLRPIPAERQAALRRALQYGDSPIRPLGLAVEDGEVEVPGGSRHVAAATAAALGGSLLHVLQPLDPALASARAGARNAVLAAFALVVLMLALLIRAGERHALREEARRALEEEVALRTGELRETNRLLTEESQERAEADRRYRSAREELAQANRLSSLGQIIAGVAHEINQPVAAIRTFSDNALRFLERDQAGKAAENLTVIGELTARIGSITAELRSFARRRTPALGPVRVRDVIDGALLLVAPPIPLERSGDESALVIADRVRLEQILVNLLQNAAEALKDREHGRIRIEVAHAANGITLLVADNGPGVAPAIAAELFTPFVSGREDGLGLGLAIARDIAREFGGELELVASPLGGAGFLLRLRKA